MIEVIFWQTKRGTSALFSNHTDQYLFFSSWKVFALSAWRTDFLSSTQSSPSFPRAGLSWPTNGITMVCYGLPWPRHSQTRIGALLQFSELSGIWRSSGKRKKMSSVSAGVVNLQVWQLIGLFSTGTGLRNTWQPAVCEGCVGMIVEWSKSSQNVQQISLHLSQIDSWWGLNLGVRKDDLKVSLRNTVIQRDQCEGLKGRVLQAGYKQWKRHAVKTL